MSQPKFCAKCGNALGENEKFCAKCGTPVEAEAAPQTAPAETVNEPMPAVGAVNETVPVAEANSGTVFTSPVPPPVEVSPVPSEKVKGGINIGKYKVPIIVGSVALVAIIAALVVILCLPKYQKIDAKDLFHFKFDGLNTQGTVVGYLNCEEACKEADSERYYKLLEAELYKNDRDDDDDDEDLDEDEKTVEDEGYSKYFAEDKKDLLKAYDKAKDKSAASDMKKALLKKSKKNESGYVLKVKFDKSSGLSNGDTIKCTVDFDEEDLKEAKIELENTEFEITVEGLVEGKKLDLFEGFEIKFEGTDGNGTANYSNTNKELPFISYSVYPGSGLSNGDSVEANASFYSYEVQGYTNIDPEDSSKGAYFTYKDTTYIIESSSATKTITVSGLQELEEIDIFKGIKFKTTGAAPYLKISSVNKEDCDKIINDYVYFTVDYDSDYLKLGDTFTVKASVNVYSLKNNGYKPNVEVDDSGYAYKEFTVDESFGSYITNESDPADVDKLEEEFKNFIEKFENQSLNKSSINGIKFDGKTEKFDYETYKNYVILPEGFAEGTISTYDPKNILYRVYKVTVTAKDDDDKTSTKTIYLAFRFTGAYIDANGEGQLASSVASYFAAAKPEELQKFYDKDEKYGKVMEVGKPAPVEPEPSDDSSKDDSSEEEPSGGDEEPSGDDSSEE